MSIDEVITLIANYYKVPEYKILGGSRKNIYVEPRHVLIYILKTDFTLTDTNITKIVHRNRGTIHRNIQKINNLYAYDKELIADIKWIRLYISSPHLFSPRKTTTIPIVKTKRIYQYSVDMDEINNFRSIRDAVLSTGISTGTISRSLSSYKRLGRGYYWIKK